MKRRLLWIGGAVLAAALAAALVLHSPWFNSWARQRLVSAVERATGGRAEIGAFHFAWSGLRAEVKDFTLHGREPAGKPPLFRASSMAVGLKVVSLLDRKVDIRSFDVQRPRIYLIVNPDGSTNLPVPKVKESGARNTIERLLELAIGRFNLEHGEFEIESRGAMPFEAHGRNLAATLSYERAQPQYSGEISIEALHAAGLDLAVKAALAFEKDRVTIASAKLTTAASAVQFSGSIENLASPHGAFEYWARLSNADAERLLGTRLLVSGVAESAGHATWQGGARYAFSGSLRAHGLEYRDRYVRLHDFRAEGALAAQPGEVRVSNLRLAGAAALWRGTVAVEARIAAAVLHGEDLALNGMAVDAVGGEFTGNATLQGWDRYTVRGAIAGFDIRRTVAIYSQEALPWDGLANGDVQLEGSFRRSNELRLATALEIAPVPGAAPVNGQVQANYDAGLGILDLGRSVIALPHSRAEISGAISRELRVHLETRDLDELLPAVGESAASFPVRLENGRAVFDGKVTGKLADPEIAGRLHVTGLTYGSTRFDTIEGDVTASPGNIALRNASLARAGLRAQFEIAIALSDWKAGDASAIFGRATAGNARLAELAGVLGRPSLPISGIANVAAQVSGSVGNPLVNATAAASHGAFHGEPFDNVSGRLTYSHRTLRLEAGEIIAGAKQVRMEGVFEHPRDRFDTGRLSFQVATNAMPLAEIRTLAEARPGFRGMAKVSAHGTVQIVAVSQGRLPVRVDDLHADVNARGLALRDQPLGDLHLTANSHGQALQAHLESNFADSTIRGDGEWRLEGDYPGTATVLFSKVRLAQLRAWILPSQQSFAANLSGWTEGSLRLEGPALEPRAITAELRIPRFEIGPAAGAGPSADAFTLRNSGDMVARLENSVVTVESARLAGRNTDLRVTGKIALGSKTAFDLRVAGKVDLAAAHDWDANFTASGTVSADASVRGTLDAPQISGRMTFEKAGFNVVDVPNGISNATGAILFIGERASIQNFTGETGGGRIQLTGFVSYGGGAPMVYRLHANARQVRVRYPEGVSTVADASLSLTGTADRSMLSGGITIRRAGFNQQSDFSSFIAQSAEPVRTPSARTGFLGGLNYEIQISTAPDVEVQSALTQDVQVEANLRLRGTVSSPALLGRVNVTHGGIVFFGTRYNISQGSISFFNPLAIEPVLNIDLETKARGIEVTLNVSGPLNKLNLTPRSDPPLQFNEIVALLATGRAPSADTGLLAGENSPASTLQENGAAALLGQALASPVTGRLERFFGVSRLRIDPTLPGLEYNPQARLTLEQQVTPDITFTYITDVTSTNPQVVSVEWAFGKQWSAVAQREENGMIGMDILFKKRF
jgi:translocation and assembly module TamB